MSEWKNHPARTEIEAGFPAVLSLHQDTVAYIAAVIDGQLRRHGSSIDTVKKIFLVYPHKDRGAFPGYFNRAALCVKSFHDKMAQAMPGVTFQMCHAIGETVHLGRSEDQSALHALTDRQSFTIAPPVKGEDMSFLEPGNFFIIVDKSVFQGTTIANMKSYIEQNGGVVIGAVAEEIRGRLVPSPERKSELRDAFGAAMPSFERALASHGISTGALTDAECAKIISTVRETGAEDFTRQLSAKKALQPQ